MPSIDHVTLDVADTAAAEVFYKTAFELGDALRVRESQEPSDGFRGYTLSLVVSQPADVDALLDAACEAGATSLKPAAKSFWGYGGVVQAPDGAIWKVATSSKKNTGPATKNVDQVVLLLGVGDVKATKAFYVERGLAVGKSFGSKYVDFDLSGSPVGLGALQACGPGQGRRCRRDGRRLAPDQHRQRDRPLHRPRRVRLARSNGLSRCGRSVRSTVSCRRPRTETMSPSTRKNTGTRPADSHDLIRVTGARVNNLKDISVEIPKRRLTVFTGVSGSGKSSLVFATIAAESQRMINETYSAFVQGFMPNLARPDVDVLEGLTTAIIVDQERMGANPRSTVGTADRRQRHAPDPVQPAGQALRRAADGVLVQRADPGRQRRDDHGEGRGPGREEHGAQAGLPRRHVSAMRGDGLGLRLRPDRACTTRRSRSRRGP